MEKTMEKDMETVIVLWFVGNYKAYRLFIQKGTLLWPQFCGSGKTL